MVSLENPENQNSEISANKSEAGTCSSFQFASFIQCYHKVYQSVLISKIKFVYRY